MPRGNLPAFGSAKTLSWDSEPMPRTLKAIFRNARTAEGIWHGIAVRSLGGEVQRIAPRETLTM